MRSDNSVTNGDRVKISSSLHTNLFPEVRLDEVLRFDDEMLLALRATKSWQDPASPAWLGAALCALAAAIGPMVRLFLPDSRTVTPNFNAVVAIPSGGSLDLNRRLLAPLANVQAKVKRREDFPLKNILTSSFDRLELRYQFTRATNGGLTIADGSADLLRRFLESKEEDQIFSASSLAGYTNSKNVEDLSQPTWDGTLNMLMFGRSEQLAQLAATPLLTREYYPNFFVLSEEFTPYDISYGHEFGFMELGPWNETIKRVMRFPNFWCLEGNRQIECSAEAAVPLEEFRVELNDVLKVIHPTYRLFVEWLPDLAAKIALILCFTQNPETSFIGVRHMSHAVAITKWLANCHFQGLQKILQVEPLPDISDRTAIPDESRRILEKLRTKGPMRPRQISRSCFQLTAPARDNALNWLEDRNLVVFRSDGLVQAVS